MSDEKNLLSELPCGERGWIKQVSYASAMRRRLLDVGMIPGTEIVCLGVSPLGDPRTYLVRGKMIAIRARDAECVVIRR